MAEATGFEPAKGETLYTLSKRAPSTTRPHFRLKIIVAYFGRFLGGILGADVGNFGLFGGKNDEIFDVGSAREEVVGDDVVEMVEL